MRDLANLRGWTIVLGTLTVGVVARLRNRQVKHDMRPKITPLRLVHNDEMEHELRRRFPRAG